MTDSYDLIVQVLQLVSASLLGLCLWVVKGLYTRVRELEQSQHADRIELERRIQDIRVDTATSVTRLETLVQTQSR